MKIILSLCLMTLLPLWAQDDVPLTSTASVNSDKPFQARESHWVATFGSETLLYDLPFEFPGERKNIKPGERRLTGARLGIGREIYLGGSLFFTPKIEAFYVGTLFKKVQTADPEYPDFDLSGMRDSGSLYGAEAGASISWLMDFKAKNPFMDEIVSLGLELVAEASLGRARAYNSKSYYFSVSGVADEWYNKIIEDEMTLSKIAGGFNILGLNTGFFLYVRGALITPDITSREIRETYKFNAGVETVNPLVKQTSVDMDPITVYMLGGGYKF